MTNNSRVDSHLNRPFTEKISALYCIKVLVVLDIVLHLVKICISSVVLFITRTIDSDDQLRLFLVGFIIISAAKAVIFYSKNKSFFYINQIPEFEDNNDVSVLSNLIEGCNLFWYVLGFHWLQSCQDCHAKNPILYYTCKSWLILGFITFIAPLVAIILLLVIITYIKPKLTTISYQQESDIPDGNTRCVICYENYRPNNSIKFLPCDHHFHSECIDEWFHVRDSCPLCKKSINILYDLLESNASLV